jgi:parallel beta-helix repeat protein
MSLSHERKHIRSGTTRLPRSRARGGLPHRLRVRAAIVLAAGALGVGVLLTGAAVESTGVAPRLLGQYLERRADSHAGWIVAIGRLANQLLQHLDRGDATPHLLLPAWAGARALPGNATATPTLVVSLPEQLSSAMAAAQPGTTITVAPGSYHFSDGSLQASHGGTAAAPITVRAETFGTVTIEFDLVEGFLVTAPYWIFENLTIRGVCASHDACEHAFHITGAAHHVVIRNNLASEFNAHIKVNGSGGKFPDDGRIANNSLVNTTPRKTANPVTPIDMVAASGWTVEGNLIADFVKEGGNYTSYGAFAKGAGTGNSFLRNVVICERRLRGAPGRRVGLSFGGGGSEASGCRDRRCIVEHDDGLIAGNLIASCSDDGVYINKSSRSQVIHNTILDTGGVNVRYPESSALVSANLIDGIVQARDSALLDEDENQTTALLALYMGWHPVRNLFVDAGALDLRFTSQPSHAEMSRAGADLCGQSRPQPARMGAFEDFSACLRAKAQ